MKKLGKAYYSGSKKAEIVRGENIALMSDLLNSKQMPMVKRRIHSFSGIWINFFSWFFCVTKYFIQILSFGLHADHNLVKILYESTYEGAAHADEMCYIFQY